MQKVKLSGAVPLFLLLLLAGSQAQDTEVYFLTLPVSKNKSITYKREIRYDDCKKLYKVQDYLENGQIQMAGGYSKFDRGIKEGLWCHYRSNVKEGEFKVWYGNGQLKSRTNFRKGLRHGLHEYWYQNGRKESVQYYKKGQKHGLCTWWYEDGRIQNRRRYKRGVNQNPLRVRYEYLVSLPKNYEAEKGKTWPLIIYLHGGSHRGENLKLLYGYGIPDQIYRGREFPFIIAAPQCQINHRWSTDDWFEDFFDELCAKYRIDGRRVYLTGLSLGGSGTWYLAGKYPDIFAAIAPISGFTGHIKPIYGNLKKLKKMPIWAFHGKIDTVVPFEETEEMVKRLRKINPRVKFTQAKNVGHEIHWNVYPKTELYDWFLEHRRGE